MIRPALALPLAATLDEPSGYIHYTPASPRYKHIAYDDVTGLPDGEWDNEARFIPKNTPAELSWTFVLSSRVQDEAIGPVTETASAIKLPSRKKFDYGDFHPDVPADYLFHSRIHVYLGQEYQLKIKFAYLCVVRDQEGECFQTALENFKLDT